MADRDTRKDDRDAAERGPVQPEDVRDLPETAFDQAANPRSNPSDRTGAQPGGDAITSPQDVEEG